MKKNTQHLYTILLVFMAVSLTFSCKSTKEMAAIDNGQVKSVSPSTLIIYYDAEIGKESLMKAVESYKAEVVYDYKNFHAIAIRISKKKSLKQGKAFFENVKGVLQVNEDQIIQLD